MIDRFALACYLAIILGLWMIAYGIATYAPCNPLAPVVVGSPVPTPTLDGSAILSFGDSLSYGKCGDSPACKRDDEAPWLHRLQSSHLITRGVMK